MPLLSQPPFSQPLAQPLLKPHGCLRAELPIQLSRIIGARLARLQHCMGPP